MQKRPEQSRYGKKINSDTHTLPTLGRKHINREEQQLAKSQKLFSNGCFIFVVRWIDAIMQLQLTIRL